MDRVWDRVENLLCRRSAVYLLLVVICFAVYFKCLFYGITKSDDEVMIAASLPFLKDFSNVFKVFTTDAFYHVKSIDLYRPLQSLSYIIDMQWGLNPTFAVHLTNLLLHLGTCIAGYHLLLLLKFRQKLALFGALVYAVHYLFAAAVAWIPARGDLLLALFVLLTLITFIRLLEKGGWKSYLLHLLFFTLALFSKETAVLLPLLLMIYLWAFDKLHMVTKRRLLLPVYYVAALTFYFTLKAMAVSPPKGVTGIIPFLKNIRYLPETVAKFFIPVNISTMPEFKLSATLAGLLIIAVLVVIHVYLRKHLGRPALFYLAWFLLFITPGMAYYPNFYSFCYEHIDHRAYLVCFGLLMLLLNLLQIAELDRVRHFRVSVAILIGYLAITNLILSGSYRNPTEFALKAIRTNPSSALAYANYGTELYLQGKFDDAFINLNSSVKICGQFLPALHYRARIFRQQGLDKEALADLDTLLSSDPDYDADDYELRALITIEMKNYDVAIRDYRSALRLNPQHAAARKGLKELERTVRGGRLLPEAVLAQELNRKGIAAGQLGDPRQAEACFRKALLSDPGFYVVNINLGSSLYQQGRVAEACAAWNTAAQHDAESAAELVKEYCH